MSAAEPTLRPSRARTAIVYGAMVAASVLSFWGIHLLGTDLKAPATELVSAPPGGPRATASDVLFHVLLALLVIVVASRSLGALFRRLHQPAVIGEVIAGIALGPSALGALAPEVASYLLPPSVAPNLGLLAQVGVILFMFLVGLELDTSLLRDKPHAAVAISHASILAPFVLGALTALWLYPRLASADVPFDLFAMFMGVAMSITAFPVLARILTDRGLHKTRLGVIAISCAAVDDVTAWCLLAVVAGMAEARARGALLTIALALAYIVFMFALVRPQLARYFERHERPLPSPRAAGAPNDEPGSESSPSLHSAGGVGQNASAVVFAALLLSALAAEAIGIHAIFGAFLLGAVIPHHTRLAAALRAKLEDLVIVLLLPAFFAFTGMRTRIGLLESGAHWVMCAAIVAVACAGKLGGSFVAARLSGLSTRDAASLGALMNTRGLMELVVLNLGLDLGVISPTLFAMMVLMAVVTTVATSPLLSLFQGSSAPQTNAAPHQKSLVSP